jgi:hypothetical protein
VDLCVVGMKITALLVLKPSTFGAGSSSSGGESGPEAVVLANAMDVSHFGYFQCSVTREFIVFVARTVLSAPSQASGSPSSTKVTSDLIGFQISIRSGVRTKLSTGSLRL